METLHACLLLASKSCDAGVVELCKKIVIADDGYFLRCARAAEEPQRATRATEELLGFY